MSGDVLDSQAPARPYETAHESLHEMIVKNADYAIGLRLPVRAGKILERLDTNTEELDLSGHRLDDVGLRRLSLFHDFEDWQIQEVQRKAGNTKIVDDTANLFKVASPAN
jgi:hypothetical protein